MEIQARETIMLSPGMRLVSGGRTVAQLLHGSEMDMPMIWQTAVESVVSTQSAALVPRPSASNSDSLKSRFNDPYNPVCYNPISIPGDRHVSLANARRLLGSGWLQIHSRWMKGVIAIAIIGVRSPALADPKHRQPKTLPLEQRHLIGFSICCGFYYLW